MKEERRKILEMLGAGKITVADAERLFAAIEESTAADEPQTGGKQCCRYLRVLVEPGPGSESADKVNIRVPMKLIRAGLRFAAFIPHGAQGKVSEALKEKGIDVDLAKITPQDLEDLVTNLNDMTVEVDGKDRVRIFCE